MIKEYKYIFGPVNSRRFGVSLGIDLSPFEKSCNFDCVYCELKGAKPVDYIKNPPKVEDIINEVKEALAKFKNINVITITSNGEPTLYKDLDKLVLGLNKIKQNKKLLILSNSSTVCDKKIADVLMDIDIVKLSLDCATQKCFKKIDRPLKGLSIDDIIRGIKTFSKRFKNTLVIEILLVKGINDNQEEIKRLNEVLNAIKPSRIDIGTIDRPPAYNVKPVDEKEMIKLSNIFTNLAVSLIHKNPPLTKENFSTKEILVLLKHRPQSQFDINNFFNENSKKKVMKLLDQKLIEQKDIGGTVFYQLLRKR